MRLLQVADDEYLNLDAIVGIEKLGGTVHLMLADATMKRFSGIQAEALLEIFDRESTDLRRLVELREAKNQLNADVPF